MCFKKGRESLKSISGDDIEAVFEDILKTITRDPKLAPLERAMFNKELGLHLSHLTRAHAALGRALVAIDRQICEKLDQIIECISRTALRAFERQVESP